MNEAEKVFNKLHSMLMGEREEIYSDKVIALAYEPLNVGRVKKPDAESKVQGNCGDQMEISFKVEKDIISEIRFLTDGCGATLACGSAITELAKGMTPYQASKIYPQNVVAYLDGLPSSHLHCSVLAVNAMQNALKNYKERINKKNHTKQ